MTPSRILRGIPAGVSIPLEIDDAALNALVREAVERRVNATVDQTLMTFTIRDMARDLVRDRVRSYFDGALPDERPHDVVRAAVWAWLESREGWVARMLRRTP